MGAGSKRPPTVLAILDGWGYRTQPFGNPTLSAKTPTFEQWFRKRPMALLSASGVDVGLPPGQAGNSEAGHLNIGAGRIVLQDSVRISRSINNGTFFQNPAFHQVVQHAKRNRSTVHLFGMLTADQSAHTDPDHLIAILVLLRRYRVNSVALHLFTDGRDSPPRSAQGLLRSFERGLHRNEVIATVMGRFYAMDRKKAWDRTRIAFQALTAGVGRRSDSAEAAVAEAYGRGESDEVIQPTIIGNPKQHRVRDHDAVVFYNLRSDRARQLTKAFVQADFVKRNPGAFRRRMPRDLLFVAMTSFGPDLPNVVTAFPSADVPDTLPFVLGAAGLRQLYVAESEKFAHITFFLNGGYDHAVAGEERVMVPSPQVKQYAAVPEMAASAITDVVVRAVENGTHDFIGVNYANADMMGHTGDIAVAERALAVLNAQLTRVANAVLPRGGLLIVTADHGNVETMLATNGSTLTEHSTAPVPFLLLRDAKAIPHLRDRGRLADVAPTTLGLLGIGRPGVMTGEDLCR